MKDKLTLLLGAYASGDIKLKPIVLYYSEILWTFTTKKLSQMNWKSRGKSNQKAWITRQMFIKLAFVVLLRRSTENPCYSRWGVIFLKNPANGKTTMHKVKTLCQGWPQCG
jgi:hypothetical protein